MLMYKLKQDKDKSPTFASCCVPAWTVCSDTPQSSLGKLRWPPGPTGAGSDGWRESTVGRHSEGQRTESCGLLPTSLWSSTNRKWPLHERL